jgi:hypothetical protein
VGERHILESTQDPVLIDIISRLVRAESEDEMEACFEELHALNDVRSAEFRKAVERERKEKKIARRVGQSELERAAAEWGMEMPAKPEANGGGG